MLAQPLALRMMVDPDNAMDLVLRAARRLAPCTVSLREACGLTLAEPIHAHSDHPPFCRALMDGYAVHAADAGATVRVVGGVSAGEAATTRVTQGHCVEIVTGAPCPPDTEAIVPIEQVVRNGDRITLPPEVSPGQYIAPKGSECRAGPSRRGADFLHPCPRRVRQRRSRQLARSPAAPPNVGRRVRSVRGELLRARAARSRRSPDGRNDHVHDGPRRVAAELTRLQRWRLFENRASIRR